MEARLMPGWRPGRPPEAAHTRAPVDACAPRTFAGALRLVVVCLVLPSAGGCTLLGTGPAAGRNKTPSPAKPVEPPQIVERAADSSAASAGNPKTDTMGAIEQWAARMQQPAEAPSGDATPASDAGAAQAGQSSNVTYEPIGSYRYAAVEDLAGAEPAAAEPADPPVNAAGIGTPPKTPDEAQTRPQAAAVPILRGVSALPAPEAPTRAPAKTTPVAGSPAANAPAHAAGDPGSLQQLVDRWLEDSPGGSFREQLDRRVLAVMAGRYDEARRPLESVSNEQQQMAARMVESLIAIRESHGAQPQEEIGRVLRQLSELREALVPLSDLSIPHLVLARSVRGFGNYAPFEPAEFPAGRTNEFVVYCELSNFVAVATKDGQYESRFGMQTRVLTPSGDVAYEMKDDAIIDRCRARRRDCFISALVRLPATLSPGRYVVKVTIVDKIGHKVAQKRATFRIVARS